MAVRFLGYDGDEPAGAAGDSAGAAPTWDGTFSDHSYGFRPSRRAHEAIAEAQYVVIRFPRHATVRYVDHMR